MKPNFDRLLKVFWREQPDYVPNYEHIIDNHVMEALLHRRMPLGGPFYPQKKAFMTFLVKFWSSMGYDYIPLELGLNLFRMNSLISTHNEPLNKRTRVWVDNNTSTIANNEEFAEYEWPSLERAIDFEMLRAAAEVLPPTMKLVSGVAGGIHEHVLQMIGIKQFSIALRREPSFIDRMFNKIGNLIEGVDKIIAEMPHVGALRMGDDLGYKKETIISPKMLRQYVFPWHKKIADLAHKQNKPFILHSCGNLNEIIEDLINDVKINAWHSFQDIIFPVTEAKAKFGERVAILGGVDLDILCRGTIDEVQGYCRNVITICKKGGGYALGSGNSIPNYINLDNYKAMLEIGKKYGNYS